MIDTELYTGNIPHLYNQFVNEIGQANWTNRVRKCNDEIRGNPLLSSHLRAENEIAYQLDTLTNMHKKFGEIPLQLVNSRSLYPAMAFIAQVLSLTRNSPASEASKLFGRVRGALKNPDDMRGLQLELAVATHFVGEGKKISWPEITKIGTFDLLVEDSSHPPLEVECKSIGTNKGRVIKTREILDFASLLRKQIMGLNASQAFGLSVVLTLPNKLPNDYRDRKALASELWAAIESTTSGTLTSGATVELFQFDTKTLGLPPFQDSAFARKIVDEISGTSNRAALIFGAKNGGIVALTIQSQNDDNFLDSIFDTLSDAAGRQLTKSRAGLLIAELTDLSKEQLANLVEHDNNGLNAPTALRVFTSRFLIADNRQHLVGVNFITSGTLNSVDALAVQQSGAVYSFRNERSPFWSAAYSHLFN
ncbi:hypothetical protein [Oxalicibacterium faecigallinarum]|uniref:Uncharacterized protein n=1 Tax=Oxalicibacterium faecigallinarum TaxID=573741 RepID=A0A8J3AN52_9BURK|nr:hypothetical protein [Oxalicibacterium faecigallinarum]GGI17608.1 hypothetical protein GCM10008066_09830 [Oxalicibacterium faecigallinarum]